MDCADHGHRHGEVGTGFGESCPADCRDVDVVAGHGETGPSFDDGEQHRQPAGVEAIGVASSLGALRHGHGERLDFDEQRSLTGHRRDDDGAGDPAATVGKKQVRGVGHTDETTVGHLEQAQLARRPEAVLGGAQQAQGVVTVALERQHRVDGVLELAGTGERAVLGDVADEHDGDAAALGLDDELLRAGAHLRRRAR